jgi:PIN domain nuclease of toxin-antitoxin system
MKILLDTQILLWYVHDEPQLSLEKSIIIDDPQNQKYISYVSLWEMTIKNTLGKLALYVPSERIVPRGVEILYPTLPCLTTLAGLPLHHRDPFDRMIIAQAITENLTVMTEDGNFALYDLKLL